MAAPRVFNNLDQLKAAAGQHLGFTEWLEITQERIDQFAQATGDQQWIHVDHELAAKGPFGRTIAHGYLTLSLVSTLLPQLFEVRSISMALNYGVNRVRFPSPVPVGSFIRGSAEFVSVDDIPGGVQVTTLIMIERKGSDKPSCVIESVSRFLA